jgi:hypothetical protein
MKIILPIIGISAGLQVIAVVVGLTAHALGLL